MEAAGARYDSRWQVKMGALSSFCCFLLVALTLILPQNELLVLHLEGIKKELLNILKDAEPSRQY